MGLYKGQKALEQYGVPGCSDKVVDVVIVIFVKKLTSTAFCSHCNIYNQCNFLLNTLEFFKYNYYICK